MKINYVSHRTQSHHDAIYNPTTASATTTRVNSYTDRAANLLLKVGLPRNLNLVANGTTTFPHQDHVDTKADENDGNNTVLVALSVLGIVLIVLGMCCLLCYREVSRRRLENGILMERARREMLRNAIKSKVEEMRCMDKRDDTESYMAVMELKVPLVTFGKVTMISPVPSTESMQSVLDMHIHRHHHHHHHHHHHYHKLDKQGGNDMNV